MVSASVNGEGSIVNEGMRRDGLAFHCGVLRKEFGVKTRGRQL